MSNPTPPRPATGIFRVTLHLPAQTAAASTTDVKFASAGR